MFSRFYHISFIVNLFSFYQSTRFVKNDTFGLINVNFKFQSEEYFARISSCFVAHLLFWKVKLSRQPKTGRDVYFLQFGGFRIVCTIDKVRTKIIHINVEKEWTWGISLFNSSNMSNSSDM